MTRDQIQHMFKHGYNQTAWKKFLGETFANANLLTTPEILTGIDSNVADKVFKLGYININEDGIERQIAVYEVELSKGIILERNRVGLRNLLRKYWKNIDAAFIVYHHADDSASTARGKWRFTYVSELTGYDSEGKFQKIQTEPKRYTYVLGEGESTRTATDRFFDIAEKGSKATLADIKNAFSVEKLSKSFFDEYKEHYTHFCDFMTERPGIQSAIFNGDEKAIRDFAKKMLGRIVFIYFIQKKGWMGVPAGSKWGEGDFNFLSGHFDNFQNKDLFYQNFLCPLFFETLNCKREDDLADYTKLGSGMCRIPYLNGGLFDEENVKYRNIVFDGRLFQNLFDFFNQYNFTIYEDDPNDQTVAVDPEMLGHIFENLLEDNKDKGAFYTPKEIVHYMCQESLIEYLTTWFEGRGYEVVLNTAIGKETSPELFPINEGKKGQLELVAPAADTGKKVDRTLIEKLLKKQLDTDDKQLVIKHADEFHTALDNVKICDPAIGSGAFPMGLLQEIFTAKETIWQFQHGNLKDFPASEIKLNIIQNSIYGVDIEKGAVDIARLRFWLSLVVDEEMPNPLPNLDYKIVVGNSLVSKLGDEIIDIDWSEKVTADATKKLKKDIHLNLNKLYEKQKQFFKFSGDKKHLQQEIRNLKIDVLISQLNLDKYRYLEKNTSSGNLFEMTAKEKIADTERKLKIASFDKILKDLQRIKEQPEKPLYFFDWKLDFPEILNENLNPNPGFDIVIGNPPYVDSENMIKNQPNLREHIALSYLSAKGNWDLYIPFHELAIRLIKNNGVKSYISPNKWLSIAYSAEFRKLYTKYLYKICNCNDVKVFDAGVTPVISFFKKTKTNYFRVDKVSLNFNFNSIQTFYNNEINENSLGILLSDFSNILIKIKNIKGRFSDWINCENPFTTNEAYRLIEILSDNEIVNNDSFKLINTGTIDPYISLWGLKNTTYLKSKYQYPQAKLTDLKLYFPKRIIQINSPKLIITGMRYLECFFDELGKYIAGKSTIIVRSVKNNRFHFFCALLNSKLVSFYIKQSFSTLGIGGGVNFNKDIIEGMPLPNLTDKQTLKISDVCKDIISKKRQNIDTATLEQKIDNLVYRLYELSYDEVKVIEPEFSLSKEEYESIEIE